MALFAPRRRKQCPTYSAAASIVREALLRTINNPVFCSIYFTVSFLYFSLCNTNLSPAHVNQLHSQTHTHTQKRASYKNIQVSPTLRLMVVLPWQHRNHRRACVSVRLHPGTETLQRSISVTVAEVLKIRMCVTLHSDSGSRNLI